MYVCTHWHTHACIHTHTRTQKDKFTCTHTHTHTSTHKHAHTHTHSYTLKSPKDSVLNKLKSCIYLTKQRAMQMSTMLILPKPTEQCLKFHHFGRHHCTSLGLYPIKVYTAEAQVSPGEGALNWSVGSFSLVGQCIIYLVGFSFTFLASVFPKDSGQLHIYG